MEKREERKKKKKKDYLANKAGSPYKASKHVQFSSSEATRTNVTFQCTSTRYLEQFDSQPKHRHYRGVQVIEALTGSK